jgi:hypothetical protein
MFNLLINLLPRGASMPRCILASIAVLLVTAGSSFSACAHSWYPSDCCSNRDCTPADSVETDARGDLTVKVGAKRIWVPRGFAVRPSQDGRIHICFHSDDFQFLMPLCLFMPAQS